MKHLQSFNEKMGINQDLENQVDDFYKEINLPENRDINEFNFCYQCDKGNFYFKLIIDENLNKEESGKQGQFSHNHIFFNGYEISLLSRKDKGVLLHELKHMDYVIQNKRANTNKLIKDVQKFDKKKSDTIYQALFLCYVFDTDEFQAKYHGYYSYIDSYIKKNLTEELKTSNGITGLINKALNQEDLDKCYQYYLNTKPFKFSDYNITQKDLNVILSKYIRDKDISSISNNTGNILKDVINTYKWGFKEAWNDIKSKIGFVSKSEQKEINELVKKLEKDINWKRKKYNRKFRRILTLMLDKYLPNKTR